MNNLRHGHIGVLDGLRAMAVLLVMAEHSEAQGWLLKGQPFLPNDHAGIAIATFFGNGWVGVDLFFILSGFLITGQLLDGGIGAAEGRWRTIGRYLKRRFFRIVPAYYLVLTLSASVAMGLAGGHVRQTAYSYIVHLLFLNNYFYVDDYKLYWSLAVEFQFYLLAPFFILLLLRIKKPGLLYIFLFSVIVLLGGLRSLAVLCWQPASAYDWFYHIRILFPFSLDGLLGGMLCNFLWRDEKIRGFLRRRYVCNGLFFGGLALFFALTVSHMLVLSPAVSLLDKTFMLTFMAAAFSFMLLGLLAGSAGQRAFSSRPLRYIALVSYSMYLIHMIVLSQTNGIVQKIYDHAGKLIHGFSSPLAMYFIDLVIFIPVTVLIATFLYYLVEKPFIDWAKKVTPRKIT